MIVIYAGLVIVCSVVSFCTGFCIGHDAAVVDWHIKTHREGRK